MSDLLDRAATGEVIDIVLRRRRGDRFRILDIERGGVTRQPALLRGEITVGQDIDEEGAAITAAFEGRR